MLSFLLIVYVVEESFGHIVDYYLNLYKYKYISNVSNKDNAWTFQLL